jgi:hypothetical protein
VEYEGIRRPTEFADHEFYAVRHQAGNEMSVTRETVELGDQDGRLCFAGRLEYCGQLRPAIKSVCARSGLDFLLNLGDIRPFGLSRAGAIRRAKPPIVTKMSATKPNWQDAPTRSS